MESWRWKFSEFALSGFKTKIGLAEQLNSITWNIESSVKDLKFKILTMRSFKIDCAEFLYRAFFQLSSY